jgi:hypothetical protein
MNECSPQLKYMVRAHLIEPLIEDEFRLFQGPNQYSMVFMSFGMNFYKEEERRVKRPEGEQEEPVPVKEEAADGAP